MKRQYEKSHPWITFDADFRKAQTMVWLALGEAQSKCEHLAGSALSPEKVHELHQVYLAKGVLATMAIEGNTLSEKEVRDRIGGKLKLPPSKEYLGTEVDNILRAANDLLENIDDHDGSLSVEEICSYNKEVLYGLPSDEEVIAGELRQHNVTVGTYRGAPGEDVRYLMQRLVEWLNGFELPKDYEIAYGILKAILAHLYIAWIHPFGDGNGRTARLVEVKILLQAGVPSSAAHLLSNHYNETRTAYYRQLDHASKSGGDVFPFIGYAVQGFVDQIRQQIEYVKARQLEAAWTNYVHEQFKGMDKLGDIRRRNLLLAISAESNPVSPRLARWTPSEIALLYGEKTARTMTRDLNELRKMHLIIPREHGFSANTALLQSLLPVRKKRGIL